MKVYFGMFDKFPVKKKVEMIRMLNIIFQEQYRISIKNDALVNQYVFWMEDEKEQVISIAALELNISLGMLLDPYVDTTDINVDADDNKVVSAVDMVLRFFDESREVKEREKQTEETYNERIAFINCVGTHENHRRKGYSFFILTKMLTFLSGIFRKHKQVSKIFLECASENQSSYGLYKKLNFTPVSSRMSKTIPYVLMAKKNNEEMLQEMKSINQ